MKGERLKVGMKFEGIYTSALLIERMELKIVTIRNGNGMILTIYEKHRLQGNPSQSR